MGWGKRGKGFLHFRMCGFLSFLFLQRLYVVLEKLVASHENEEIMLEIRSIVENGLTNVESSSQKVVDKLKVNYKESMIEDHEIIFFDSNGRDNQWR
jgi:hypothetical protein